MFRRRKKIRKMTDAQVRFWAPNFPFPRYYGQRLGGERRRAWGRGTRRGVRGEGSPVFDALLAA
jgi:hypothetical protein